MKYLSSVLFTSASVLAGALIVGSASAAGISFSTSAGDNTYDAFDLGNAPGYTFEDHAATISTLNNIVAPPTLTNNYAVPLGDTSKYLAVQPKGSGTVDQTLRGAIWYTSEALLSTFSIYWGSADPSNKLEFYNGSTFIQAITGSDVFGANANGDHFSADSNKYVTFNADANSKFDKIRFSTGQIAFEFDQKRSVPVPAVVPGIALAAAFFGSKALKRNKKNSGEVVA